MLVAAGVDPDRDSAWKRCEAAITSGRAAEVFARMVAALGGPADFVENPGAHLPRAPVVRPVAARGTLVAIDTRAIGNAIIELGGGRRRVGEALDLAVGFSDFATVGTVLDEAAPLAVIHAASEVDAARAEQSLLAACTFGDEAPDPRPVITEILTGDSG